MAESVKDRHTLIVGEGSYMAPGVSMYIAEKSNRLQLTIDLATLREAGLKVSAQLVKLCQQEANEFQ